MCLITGRLNLVYFLTWRILAPFATGEKSTKLSRPFLALAYKCVNSIKIALEKILYFCYDIFSINLLPSNIFSAK